MPSMTNHSRTKVLMAGVVPPPVHGASLATQALFSADLSPIEKTILEIRSSKNLEEVGRASFSKIFGLFTLIIKALRLKSRSRASVLYYTPGSGALVPFVRDILFLGCCRPFFTKTCLHYHSGGLVDYLNANPVRKFLGRHIYGRKAWAITLSKHVAVPSIDFGAEREIEIPNGIAINGQQVEKQLSDTLRILFLGNLFETKGIFDILAACQKIAQRSEKKIRLQFVGKWPDPQTERKFSDLVQASPQSNNLEIPTPQPLYGGDKWLALSQADLFVFPSYYALENFPLVLLEAMAFGLPVIATNWRGIPSIVEDGVTGFLHDVGNVDQLANLIEIFIKNPYLLEEMGAKGKARYLENFTFEKHRDLMIQTLQEAGAKA